MVTSPAMAWPLLFALVSLTIASVTIRRNIIPPTSTFSALWIAGLVAYLTRPEVRLSGELAATVAMTVQLLFIGEQTITPARRRVTPSPARHGAKAATRF